MDMQRVAEQFRLSNWSETVKERITSGQTVSDFCAEKGISKTTYYYRQKKVREAACAEILSDQNHENKLVPSGWVQLETVADRAEASVTLEVNGCRITATAKTDLELLAKVCRALRSL